MTRSCPVLLICLLMTACQIMPSKPSGAEEWAAWTRSVDSLDPAEIPARREGAMRDYDYRPEDLNRLRFSYLLSRPDPSMQQLARSREILAEISSTSELAPFRDQLDREVELLMRLKRNQGRILELEAQLEALKAIEEAMIESRQSMEEQPP